MTIEQRLEQVEQQNQRIQRTNKRLTVALTMMAVVVCAVVTMAATGDKDGDFDTVTTGSISVRNGSNIEVIRIGPGAFGNEIVVNNDQGKNALWLGSGSYGDGFLQTFSDSGKMLVRLGKSINADGALIVYSAELKEIVSLQSDEDGGWVKVYNKSGETIATMQADEYGNGVVGAWNRKGKGRTLQPGP
jgi:hypothetical protein